MKVKKKDLSLKQAKEPLYLIACILSFTSFNVLSIWHTH